MDAVRPADARIGNPLHLALGARGENAGGPALFPDPQGRRNDVPQQRRLGCPQGAGGTSTVGAALPLRAPTRGAPTNFCGLCCASTVGAALVAALLAGAALQ